MVDETEDQRAPTKVASRLLETLPRIASCVLGVTAIAYVIGWRLSSVYYSKLGAPWAANILTIQQMSASASVFVLTIVCTAMFAIVGVISKQATARGLLKLSTVLFIAGTILYPSFDGLFGEMTWRYGPTFEALAGLLFAATIGLSLGELVALLADGRSMTEYLPHWVGPLLIAALFQGPQAFATGLAQMDGRSPSPLPMVTLAEPDDHPWMMIGPVGDHLLLIAPNADVHARKFRLVAPSMIASIGAPPSIAAGVNAPAVDQKKVR